MTWQVRRRRALFVWGHPVRDASEKVREIKVSRIIFGKVDLRAADKLYVVQRESACRIRQENLEYFLQGKKALERNEISEIKIITCIIG